MRRHRRWSIMAGLALTALCAAAATARGVEVRRVLWGFDGKAVPERVNLLSVQVDNPTAQPVSADAAVYAADPAGGRTGARIVQPLYLAPRASRWLQFDIYVGGTGERWMLETGDRTHRLDPPQLGPPACVYLQDPGSLRGSVPNLKGFPDELFPTSVAATDGLGSLVLDHAPRWESLRRQALVDWLREGGTVHLMAGPDGALPTFTAELSVLNGTGSRSRVGAGLVVRHAPDEPRLSEGVLAEQGFPPFTLQSGQQAFIGNVDSRILQDLTRLVQPKRSWLLMYLALLLYGVLVVPVNWLMSRRRRNYLVPLVFFLACVAGATVVFSYVGRRGYGEVQRQISLAVARQLEDGVYDVTHWTNVFVTHGGNYTLSYPGDYGIYSTGPSFEKAAAVVQNGARGSMLADMPLFSSRTLIHRGKTAGPKLGVRLERLEGGQSLQELVCTVGPGFPSGVTLPCALHNGRFYGLYQHGDRLELTGSAPQTPDSYLGDLTMPLYVMTRYTAMGEDAAPDVDRALRELRPVLIAYCLGGTEEFIHRIGGGPPDDGRVRLFLFAPATGQLAGGPAGGKQTCFVLYSLDLFPPEDAHE